MNSWKHSHYSPTIIRPSRGRHRRLDANNFHCRRQTLLKICPRRQTPIKNHCRRRRRGGHRRCTSHLPCKIFASLILLIKHTHTHTHTHARARIPTYRRTGELTDTKQQSVTEWLTGGLTAYRRGFYQLSSFTLGSPYETASQSPLIKKRDQ